MKKNGFSLCKGVCAACRNSRAANKHKCRRTGQEWEITAPITCHTTNVIYKLECKRCSWVYIGETQRSFAERINEHRGYISQKKTDQPSGAHFNSRGHQPSDLIATAIERVLPKKDKMLLKCREKLWINNYGSSSFGGNKKD